MQHTGKQRTQQFYHLTAIQLTSQTTYTDPIKRNTATENQLPQQKKHNGFT